MAVNWLLSLSHLLPFTLDSWTTSEVAIVNCEGSVYSRDPWYVIRTRISAQWSTRVQDYANGGRYGGQWLYVRLFCSLVLCRDVRRGHSLFELGSSGFREYSHM